MGWLSEEQFTEILNTVSIYPILSPKLGDLSRYSFDCGRAAEYKDFLLCDAKRLEMLCVSRTFVLLHNATKELIGYFSLAADTVKLTAKEKETTDFSEVVFMSLPAVKLGKLAINKGLSPKAARKGYGSFVIDIVTAFAYRVLESGVACRFVTVDADIEYERSTTEFYEKNGFVFNLSRSIKASDRTVSMRKDIFG